MDKQGNVTALYDLSWGYRAARVLHVANDLDIFTLLDKGPLSAKQISEQIKSNPKMTEKLLLACASMGLLERQGDRYTNSGLAQTYLVRGGRLYQGDIIAHSASVTGFWNNLGEEIREGSVLPNWTPQEHRNFIMGMHNIAVGGRGQLFLDAVDLSGRRKLFDVGGGPGTYSIMACKRYPELRAVVFDLGETIAIAKEVIAAEQMEDRVSVQVGDWGVDDFGEGNDVVLLSDVMHGPDSDAPMKLRKAYDSLSCGGLLVIQEFLLDDVKTGPLICALFNLMVGAYSQEELLAEVGKAGFAEAAVVFSSQEIGSGWITAKKL